MKHGFFTLIGILLFANVLAQKVTGTLTDAIDASPLIRATVTLLKSDSTSKLAETVSGNTGSFVMNDVKPGRYILRISSIGYGTTLLGFNMPDRDFDFGAIKVSKSAETLSNIVISGAPPPVRMKGDTAEFSASQFKVNPDATTEDLIKKMPGVTVDKNGTVTAQGETVKKVTVDGRDFFGDDATATLRNLPSEIVDKIQVFDRLSDQSQLTGFDDGNSVKSINIVTKANMRQGNFGRIYAGYGTDDRYAAGGNISFFNNARRISIVGLTNNINQQNFSSEDLVGASGGGRGGMRGGGGGRWGGGGDFYVGQQSGISKTNSIGINFSDAWGKKVDVSAAYFFNNSKLNNIQEVNTQNLFPDSVSKYENTTSQTENYNHRLNLRLNYRIDSSNTLLLTANGSFQTNNSFNDIFQAISNSNNNATTSATDNYTTARANAFNFRTGLLYSHAFAKKGRSISLGFYTTLNKNNGDNYNDAVNTYYKPSLNQDTVKRYIDNDRKSNNYSFNLVYTEPIAPKTQLQVNYNPAFQNSTADQETFDYDNNVSKYSKLDTILSNKFDNDYNTQNAGLTIRHGDRDNMFSAGISYQYSDLKSAQVFPDEYNARYTFSNFLANAMGRFKVGKNGSVRLFYRSSVNSPSVNQLQNVINTSNQFLYTIGNPDLKQQYTHRGMLRYSYANRLKSTSFFANFFVSGINNYISNATYTATQDSLLANDILLHRGSQLSKPVNLDGYISARSFFNYSMPLKFIKTNLNMNGGFSYSRQPGLLNNVLNISNNYNYNIGAVLASNVSEYVDFNISYSANFNNVNNTIRPEQNDNYVSQSAGISLNLLSKKGTFFQNSLSNESYSGLASGYNQSYWLWNMAVGQKFLKSQRGEIKLSVFDLLKQNKSITRDVTESYIQDVRNQVLQQYFLLTFTYKLRNFGKAPERNGRTERHNFGGMGAPPPPPMY